MLLGVTGTTEVKSFGTAAALQAPRREGAYFNKPDSQLSFPPE